MKPGLPRRTADTGKLGPLGVNHGRHASQWLSRHLHGGPRQRRRRGRAYRQSRHRSVEAADRTPLRTAFQSGFRPGSDLVHGRGLLGRAAPPPADLLSRPGHLGARDGLPSGHLAAGGHVRPAPCRRSRSRLPCWPRPRRGAGRPSSEPARAMHSCSTFTPTRRLVTGSNAASLPPKLWRTCRCARRSSPASAPGRPRGSGQTG
jgi:hypothetical protein